MNIAIDGPSGAGKSTIAKLLARELDITYLDTGAMYRALALKAFENGVSPLNEPEVQKLISDVTIDIYAGKSGTVVLLDGRDVSLKIREHAISKMASDISSLHSVRTFLAAMQQKIAAERDSVLDGRDIGTVVLPNADFKFYLTATPEARAHRRYLELCARGESPDEARIKEDIIERDYNDMHRKFSPLRKADDAIEVDSTGMTIEQVKDLMLGIVKGVK